MPVHPIISKHSVNGNWSWKPALPFGRNEWFELCLCFNHGDVTQWP